MFLTKINIKNYRLVKDMEINFTKGVNLIIGDNGLGKTSILDAIAVGLGGYINGVKDVTPKNILEDDIRQESLTMGDGSITRKYNTPTSIGCTCDISGKILKWERRRKEINTSKTTTLGKDITKYVEYVINDDESVLPLLCYYSTDRLLNDSKSKDTSKFKNRYDGYKNSMNSNFDFKSIESWCLKMEMIAFQENKKIQEYEVFKKTLSEIMQKIERTDFLPKIYYDRKFETIVYCKHNNIIPISYFSAGYKSIFKIAIDMTYRSIFLNPKISNVNEVGGIVIIDEIDMHLHPKWQWIIISKLEEVFPKIQFIIATHSPIVISSCKSGNLIMIDEEQEIKYLNNAYAYSVNDVLELRQGSYEIPEEVKKLYDLFEEFYNKADYDNAKKIIREMIEKYGKDNSEVKNALWELGIE